MTNQKTLSAITFAIALPTIVTLIYFVWLHGVDSGIQQVAFSGGKVVQFLFPVVWIWLFRRERLTWNSPNRRGVAIGVAFGLVVSATMFVVYQFWLKGSSVFPAFQASIVEKISSMGFDRAWKFAGLGVFYAICHSFLEEYYWRWFVYRELMTVTTKLWANLISSSGFMAHHVILLAVYFGWDSPLTYLFSLGVAIGGAFWAWLYDQSDSLYGPWISHLLVDAAIFLIGFDLARQLFS